ncbi:unnamed protein product, partial [Closterium sp. NIES-65]
KQQLLPESEWDAFVASMRQPLPTTFRINANGPFAMHIRDEMERHVAESFSQPLEVEGERVEAPRVLPWYPDRLGWHLNISRQQLRTLPELNRLFDFIKRENEIGAITRQEAVSMIPPLLLDVQPHHNVLDMCAAPGSKTFQLLEMLHGGCGPAQLPSGMVVANELDIRRCHLLVHQTQRLSSPCILVTNHAAQLFPSLSISSQPSAAAAAPAPAPAPAPAAAEVEKKGEEKGEKAEAVGAESKEQEGTKEGGAEGEAKGEGKGEGEGEGELFDRILCDVPCSGDGTMRKAPDIWKKWNTGNGNGLHALQIKIAMRAVALLRVGGRLVYSTCSLNPLENEAVVAQILRESNGCMRLVDCSHMLPNLKRSPGLKSWKVKDRFGWHAHYTPRIVYRGAVTTPSMFPSGKAPAAAAATAAVAPAAAATDGAAVVADAPAVDCKDAAAVVEGGGKEGEGQQESTKEVQGEGDKEKGGEEGEGEEGGEGKEGEEGETAEGEEGGKPEGRQREGRRWRRNAEVVEEEEEAEAEVCEQPVELCVRVLPHQQDTGGFFIAVLDKVAPYSGANDDDQDLLSPNSADAPNSIDGVSEPGDPAEEAEADAEADPADEPDAAAAVAGPGDSKEQEKQQRAQRRQQQGRWRGVDPVLFLSDEPTITSVEAFYGILPAFPLRSQLIVRSEAPSHSKRIYLVSKPIAQAIRANQASGQRLKMVSTGVKLFERQSTKDGEVPCCFRLSAEGLPFILPFITRQLVHVPPRDFRVMLSKRSVLLTELTEGVAKDLEAADMGCVVLVLDPKDSPQGEQQQRGQLTGREAVVIVWRGRRNVGLMLSK